MYNQEKINDVAIIGAGPAGISCAIQLKRYGIKPLLLEKNQIGGLLRNANLVENFPGFPQGISGRDLVCKLRLHAENAGLEPVYKNVNRVGFTDGIFSIGTEKSVYKSRFMVIATGTIPGKTEIEIPQAAENRVFYEVYDLCLQENAGKKTVIIGAGDAAFDYALNLAENTCVKEAIILNRGIKTRCLELLKDRAFINNKITYIENKEITRIDEQKERLNLICTGESSIETDYLLFAIGREPNLAFLSREFSEKIEDLKNRKKLFFIGDVKNDIFRQTAIAAGDGIRAAMEVHKAINDAK